VNFIERLFHIFPDAGSGVTEASCIAVFLMAIATFSLRIPLRKAISYLTRNTRRNSNYRA
jgi:hypothetical protein